MLSKEKLIEMQTALNVVFRELKEYDANWYASLRIPALELERRFEQFIKGMK
jgi:hypothetical protein